MEKPKENILVKCKNLIGGSDVIFYSLTIFGVNMISGLMGSALSFFYTEVLHIATASVAMIFLVSKIWDAVNDPIMGVFVDKTNTKLGKCIPYLRYAPLPLFIVSALIFFPFKYENAAFMALMCGALYILFDGLFTAIDIPVNSLQPLLFTDQKARNKAVSVSSTLGSTGTILPSGLYFALVVLVGGYEQSPMGNFIVATAILGIGCLCVWFSSRKLKEKIVIENTNKSFLETLKPLFKNKYLLIMLLVSLLSGPINMSSNALVYFCTWNFTDTNLGTAVLFPLLQISSGASWMISILCVPYLLKKVSKKRLFFIMCAVGAVANTLLYFIGYSNIWVYILVKFFANFPSGIIATLTTLLITDTIEYTEWKTGKRTEGVTFSLTKLIGKISAALVSSLTMFMLTLVNYDSGKMQATLQVH